MTKSKQNYTDIKNKTQLYNTTHKIQKKIMQTKHTVIQKRKQNKITHKQNKITLSKHKQNTIIQTKHNYTHKI